jgi:hypothetical protein
MSGRLEGKTAVLFFAGMVALRRKGARSASTDVHPPRLLS